jgi:ribosome maturation factor RimP
MSQVKFDEPRLVREDGMAARLAALAEPVAHSLGFRIVRVRLTGAALQLMAERDDGTFSIDDCERLSRALSPVLDAEDIISGSYQLEVSSPGIDRPLARLCDFARYIGYDAKIEFTQMIKNRKRGRAILKGADEKEVELSFEGEAESWRVPYSMILEAKLVLNDKLLAQAQKRTKQGLADGAAFDAAQHNDIELSEDRRKFHGCR